jgi:hypothetical protein
MTDRQKIQFRQMQAMFFEDASKYPGDADRIEKQLQIMEGWIDKQIENELSRVLGANSTLLKNGVVKGGKA